MPEIVECHHVPGTFDYLLRVEVPDLPSYERFHADQLAALHNVGQLVTYISMTDFSTFDRCVGPANGPDTVDPASTSSDDESRERRC